MEIRRRKCRICGRYPSDVYEDFLYRKFIPENDIEVESALSPTTLELRDYYSNKGKFDRVGIPWPYDTFQVHSETRNMR